MGAYCSACWSERRFLRSIGPVATGWNQGGFVPPGGTLTLEGGCVVTRYPSLRSSDGIAGQH